MVMKKTLDKYAIKYKVETWDPMIDAAEATAQAKKGWGSTHALFGASILYPPSGSLSVQFFSMDGRNKGKELEDKEWLKIWFMLSQRLSVSKTLDPDKKLLCEKVTDAAREILFDGHRCKGLDCATNGYHNKDNHDFGV
jgi:ABC-type glycerol-3-phosphate transport system substrate-binding protein